MGYPYRSLLVGGLLETGDPKAVLAECHHGVVAGAISHCEVRTLTERGRNRGNLSSNAARNIP